MAGSPTLVADAHQYVVGFSAPDQTANDTIQLTTAGAVPEPATWVMFGLGFAALGAVASRRKRPVALFG